VIGYGARVPQPVRREKVSWSPTLRRSVALFGAFRKEQSEPAVFYNALARDSVGQLSQYVDLEGRLLLDVGGGPGYFRTAFEKAGSRYFSLDADVGELSGLGEIGPGTVTGSGMDLPFADGVVDVCYSSNVLEHVSRPWRMAEEMVRVTKPGGLVFISYTVWFGPWGGHETSPWHYLGGHRARRRFVRKNGVEPKNKFGESLFAPSAGAAIRWAKACPDAELLAVQPRYHPWWAAWVVHVPGLREIVSWNLLLVLRKKG